MQVKTKNLIVVGLASFFVAYLWYAFLYTPMQSQASKAKTAAKEAQARVSTLQHQLNGDTDTARKKATAPNAADLSTALPVDPAEAQLLRDVNGLIASSGVKWQSITPGTPTTAGSMSTIQLGIQAGGSYDQVMRAVQGLLGMKRALVVDTVLIQNGAAATPGATGSASGAGSMQLQVSARVFSQAAPGTAQLGTAGTLGAGPAPTATPSHP